MRHAPLVLALALVLVSSCTRKHDPVAPPPPDDHGGRADLVTRVSITPQVFAPGETALIRVALTNRSSRAVTLCFTSGCTIAFQVRDGDGQVVAPGGFVCTLDAPCFEMAAGETRTAEFTWQGERYDPYAGFRPLPPGKYWLFGGLNAFNFSTPSEPVMVELLPTPGS